MSLVNVVLIAALIACFAYMVLGLTAAQHQSSDSTVDKGWVVSPLWALFPAAYDEAGKSLCAKGKVLFWAATGLTILWIILDKSAGG